jgi:DNA-binding IscR family transcriptional regulator
MEYVKVSTRGDYASRALLSLALHASEDSPIWSRSCSP